MSGVINSVGNAIGDVVGGVGDVVGGAVNAVGDLTKQIDDVVGEIPGGWKTVAAVTGMYYSPEIGAYINGTTGQAVTQEAALEAAQQAATQTATSFPVANSAGQVLETALPPLSQAGTVVAPAVAPAVASTAAPTTLADLGSLGSGTFALPGDLGTELVTQGGLNAAPAVGQLTGGAALTAPAIAGTGAASQGLLGAATDAAGNILPATAGGAAAGTAAAGASNLADMATGAGLAAAVPAVAGATAGNALSSMLPYLAAGNVASSLLGANAAQKAAELQSAAANRGIDLQKYIFDTLNQQQAPYREAGYGALSNIQGQLPYLTSKFTPEDFAAGIDPGYAFRLKQGQMAAQRAGNLKGMTGNVLTGLQDYTQGLASQEYQKAFDRNIAQKSNIYNTLAGIAGIGQTAQGQTNQAAGNYGTNASNLLTGGAAAQAAGQVGTANAISGGLGNVMNTYTLASLLNQNPSVA